ncbi:MAG: ABC transporter substrate-binding protein, partial [Verrucomicrobiota bacterium]
MKSGKSYPARTPGGSPLLQGTLGLLLVGLLSSCGSGSKKAASSDASGSAEMILAAKTFKHPAAEAYYASNSDFFRSADPTEIPADLQWVDGMDQESFSSTNAKRGGTETVWIQDFPRTLRYLGPDANGSFRRYINDNLNLKVVHKHPETGRYYPGLAREWAIAPNNLTVYLKLDPEARYTDGVAVTADDYYFLFYFMRSPWLQGPWYLNWYTSKYTHITRYDDHTIAIGLSEAKPDCLRFFEQDIRPVPRHFYKDFRESYVQDYQWKLEPGTGAYTIL